MKTCEHFSYYLAEFLEREIFRTNLVENVKTRFMLNNVSSKLVPFMR